MPFKPADKKLGQHFLHDRRAIRRIVDAVEPRRGEPLLEIGPGRGALTHDLLEASERMAVVELDGDLARAIHERFHEKGLIVFERDILSIRFAEVLARLKGSENDRLVIAGNLPYNISQPVAEKLVRERGVVDRAVLMFQREVAERLTSGPGSKAYGPLGILAGTAYRIRSLFDLPPGAFQPPPKIFSSVTLWTRRESSLDDAQEANLRSCLSVCFARRRKTLRNNLRVAAPDEGAVDRLLDRVGVDGGARAETIPADAFLRMAEHWNDWNRS